MQRPSPKVLFTTFVVATLLSTPLASTESRPMPFEEETVGDVDIHVWMRHPDGGIRGTTEPGSDVDIRVEFMNQAESPRVVRETVASEAARLQDDASAEHSLAPGENGQRDVRFRVPADLSDERLSFTVIVNVTGTEQADGDTAEDVARPQIVGEHVFTLTVHVERPRQDWMGLLLGAGVLGALLMAWAAYAAKKHRLSD